MRDYLGVYKGLIKQKKRLEDLLSIHRTDLLLEDFEAACDFYLHAMHDPGEVLYILSRIKGYRPGDEWNISPLSTVFLNQYYRCYRVLESAADGELVSEKFVTDSVNSIVDFMVSEMNSTRKAV